MPAPSLFAQVSTVPGTRVPGSVSLYQGLLVVAMLVCWAAAVVISVWGSVRDAQQAEREARKELEHNPAPGPTPGIEGFMEHWAVWALGLVAAGLVLLALAARRG